jgi:hypothetical protein
MDAKTIGVLLAMFALALLFFSAVLPTRASTGAAPSTVGDAPHKDGAPLQWASRIRTGRWLV